jgi:spermidine synthase
VLFVFGVSGFTSLALEVIWFRVLVIFMGPTAYAFAIMLATVLAGIALGSALVTPWMRRQIDWVALLAILQIAVSVAALMSFRALAFIRPAAGYVDEAWAQMTVGVHYLATVLVGSVFAILPTAVLLGLAFPIGVRVWAGLGEDRRQAAARVGVFNAVNLCGAVFGPLAAGFWLLPRAGSRASLIAIAGMTLASAFVLLSVLAPRRPRFAAVAALGGALAFAAAATNLDQALGAALARAYGSEERLWWDEGVQTTVMVNRRPAGPTGPGMRILYLDGWHQANDSPGTLFMERTIGVLPMLLHPEPSRALVIGLGGGATAGAIARLPGVQVDVVELSPSVARAADEWFSHSNFGLLRRPNVSLRVDDGRNYLLLTDQRFDVITADIIIPRHAGSGNLYSAEYFQLARRALTRGGMMLQWLGGDTDVENRTIMGTFLNVFPYATLWAGRSLLIGTVDPLLIRRDQVERRLADPATGAALEVAGITNFEMLRLLYDAGPEELRVYVGDGPILTDDRPFMEYFLSPVDKRDADMSGLTGDMMRHVR